MEEWTPQNHCVGFPPPSSESKQYSSSFVSSLEDDLDDETHLSSPFSITCTSSQPLLDVLMLLFCGYSNNDINNDFDLTSSLIHHVYVEFVSIEDPGALARRNSPKYLVPADLVETAFLAITIGL